MSYHRNGVEKWCIECGKYKPAHGFEKSATGHEHICAECISIQKERKDETKEIACDGL